VYNCIYRIFQEIIKTECTVQKKKKLHSRHLYSSLLSTVESPDKFVLPVQKHSILLNIVWCADLATNNNNNNDDDNGQDILE